jgi:WD40 repeat protein
VRTLSFSPEGVYFFSGGGEGAVLKWELVSGRRVALVPRLGSNVTSMVASHSSVVVSLENNVIKIFTANLDDDQMITGLSKETQDSGTR